MHICYQYKNSESKTLICMMHLWENSTCFGTVKSFYLFREDFIKEIINIFRLEEEWDTALRLELIKFLLTMNRLNLTMIPSMKDNWYSVIIETSRKQKFIRETWAKILHLLIDLQKHFICFQRKCSEQKERSSISPHFSGSQSQIPQLAWNKLGKQTSQF